MRNAIKLMLRYVNMPYQLIKGIIDYQKCSTYIRTDRHINGIGINKIVQ